MIFFINLSFFFDFQLYFNFAYYSPKEIICNKNFRVFLLAVGGRPRKPDLLTKEHDLLRRLGCVFLFEND